MRPSRWVIPLAALLFLWNLWGPDLAAPDEPYFAEGAREMVVDGQWAVPHVNGVVTTDKPPLFFWLIALASLPFGTVTSLTARLPSALAAIGTVALTLRLGRRLGGERIAGTAGVVLITAWMFWDKARSAQIDSLLCFLILASMSAFHAFISGEAGGRRAGILFWSAAALAVLAKGPVGVIIPVGIALAVLILDRGLPLWRRFAPVSGPIVFASVIALWIAVATVGGGNEYSVWSAFEEHVARRAVMGMHHVQPPWYYLEVLPVQLLPWSGLLAGALVLAARRRDAADRFLAVFSLFVLVFFSIWTEKRDLYVLPAFPALSLLIARLVDAARHGESPDRRAAGASIHRRWVTVPLALTGGVLVGAGAAVPLAALRTEFVPLWIALSLGALLAALGLATTWRAVRGLASGSVAVLAGGTCLVHLMVATLLLPALEPVTSARHFAVRIRTATAASREAGREVLSYRLGNLPEAFAFFSDGVYFRVTRDPADLAAHLLGPETVYAVADEAELGRVPAEARERIDVMESTRLGGRTVVLIRNTAGPREGS